jgi:hypothetical protein
MKKVGRGRSNNLFSDNVFMNLHALGFGLNSPSAWCGVENWAVPTQPIYNLYLLFYSIKRWHLAHGKTAVRSFLESFLVMMAMRAHYKWFILVRAAFCTPHPALGPLGIFTPVCTYAYVQRGLLFLLLLARHYSEYCIIVQFHHAFSILHHCNQPCPAALSVSLAEILQA